MYLYCSNPHTPSWNSSARKSDFLFVCRRWLSNIAVCVVICPLYIQLKSNCRGFSQTQHVKCRSTLTECAVRSTDSRTYRYGDPSEMGEVTRDRISHKWNVAMGRCSRQAVVTMKKSRILQASSQFLVQLLLLAARSTHCPQTPRCQLQSVQTPQSTSRPLRSSPWVQTKVLRLLQGRFASEFEEDGGA